MTRPAQKADCKLNDSIPLDVTQFNYGNPISPDDAAPIEHPERIGRYRIAKVLGKGDFGLVYLVHDEQLNRLISTPEDAAAYLAEARTVANLDQPGIVQVHDADIQGGIRKRKVDAAPVWAPSVRGRRLHIHSAAGMGE